MLFKIASLFLFTAILSADAPPLKSEVIRLLKGLEIKSIVDVPCGTMGWADDLKPVLQKYIGVDINPKNIEENREKYGSSTFLFQNLDISKDLLPQAELIFCHDALNFFTPNEIKAALLLFKKSGAKYLLLTLHTDLEKNHKGKKGACTPINWQLPPYNFPTPLLVLNEQGNKKLSLWKIEDLP